MLQYLTCKTEALILSFFQWKLIWNVYQDETHSKHCCFRYKGVYHLIIHTDKYTKKLVFDGQLIDFSELSLLVRKELHIPLNKEIAIKVYTCYGGTMPYYVDNKTLIVSAFANQEELNFKPISLNSFEFSYAA